MSLVGFAWLWIALGLVSGVVLGLFFADDNWLGGYASWRRRMLRLGHISFFGTAGLVLAAHFSTELSVEGRTLLVAGAVAMPSVCALAAAWRPLRHLFFIPVSTLCLGTLTVLHGVMS